MMNDNDKSNACMDIVACILRQILIAFNDRI